MGVVMRKSGIYKLIAAAMAAGLIMSGYNYSTDSHKAMAYSETNGCMVENNCVSDKVSEGIKEENGYDKDFLIITWNEESNMIDKLADIAGADIYKPEKSSEYTRTYANIDMSAYSTYFVNLCGGSENSINILEQIADEYYLDGKTIIPLYDSATDCFDEINELEDMTEGSVWLTGGMIEESASEDEIRSWLKGLGMFLVSETECNNWCR